MKTQKKRWSEHGFFSILCGSAAVPAYIPLYYRMYLLLHKLKKSLKVGGSTATVPAPAFQKEGELPGEIPARDPHLFINKTVSSIDTDLSRSPMREVAERIESVKESLAARGLRFTTIAGNFKEKDSIPSKERNKLWENAWLLSHVAVQRGQRILDIGGASSIFSFFLAAQGCHTHVIDNDWADCGIIYNARYVAQQMKWPLRVYNRDITKALPFKDSFFDAVFCICVLEHLPPAARRILMSQIGRVLKPTGKVGLTIDYDAARTGAADRGLRFSMREALMRDVIIPSGLSLYGNAEFCDDCPDDFFLGALFLQK